VVMGPLPDRVQFAILDIIFRNPANAQHRDRLDGWRTRVRYLVPGDFIIDADLLDAFKVLWKAGLLDLTKPDNAAKVRQAQYYSGDDADDQAFFYSGPFDTVATQEGRSHWVRIQADQAPARAKASGS
jgi:hypothetical protein